MCLRGLKCDTGGFLGSSQNARGRGVFFFSNFMNFCRHSPIMFGIFPSFTVEISQKSMEHTEATKLREFQGKVTFIQTLAV